MGEKWRANVAYGPAGTKVEFEGTVYELIQPHTSQIGWEPTLTPALWRVARNQDSGSGHHSSSHHSDHKHEEKKPEKKEEHHHHHSDHKHEEKKQEKPQEKPQQQAQPAQQQQQQPAQQQQQPAQQQQQQQPAQQQQAQPQPQAFQQQQNIVNQAAAGPAYRWVDFNGTIPQNAISVTNNNLKKTFVVARGNVDGGIHPGYVDPAKGNGGRLYFGYGGKEIVLEKFQILVIEPNRYTWVDCNNPSQINGTPVEGGHENDNTPLYVTKCLRGNDVYFGKTSKKAPCAYYGFNTKEERVQQFQVLCVNN